MFNILALLIGLFSASLLIPAFLPFLGWANWVIVPVAVLGAVVGQLDAVKWGRNLCLLVILLGVGRLMLGGGII